MNRDVIREARRCVDEMRRLGLNVERIQPLFQLVVDQEEQLMQLEMRVGMSELDYFKTPQA
jgi:hypothetical protein